MRAQSSIFFTALNAALVLIVSVGLAGAAALQLNGVNQSVQIPDSASVSPTGPITVEAWINRAASGVQHSIVEKYGCNATDGGYVLRVTATDRLLFGTRDDCNNGSSVIGNVPIPAGVWTHVAGSWDGVTLRVFVNGVTDTSTATTRNPKNGATALKIGERGNGGTPFNGQIDDVRLWSVARTAAQIAANRTVCLTGSEAGLAGYWRLDEGAGVTTADATANGNTGTLVNGAGWAAVGAFVCGAPPPPPPPPPGPPQFDALEIFPPVAAGPLIVPAPLFTGAVADTTQLPTNGLVGSLPSGTICDVVLPGATILAINTDPVTGGHEYLVDFGGGQTALVYDAAGSVVDPVAVGSIVKIVADRSLAPGPIVIDVMRVRPLTVPGLGILLKVNGLVTKATATVWTVAGADFNILGPPVPTANDVVNPVLGVTEATVFFSLVAGAVPPPPPGSPLFDALEILPPVVATLTVPAPLFTNAKNNTNAVPVAFLPPGSIIDVVMAGATILAINTDGATGGREYVLDAGIGVPVRAYTHSGTVTRDPLAVGSIVKVVGARTLVPGPIVIDVIRLRPTPVPGLDFAFFYQGTITQADPDVWTIGGVKFNIVPVTGALPTANDIVSPVLGVTPALVLFVAAPGVVLGPPTLTVAATDASAAEAGSDPAVFTITRTGLDTIPLNISYTLTGTAGNGTDYGLKPLSVAMPIGVSTATVTITPIDDALVDPNETVILTLTANAAYILGAPSSATATITDNDVAPPPPPPGTANALALNGVNQSVQVPDNASVSPTGPITIEAWVRRSVIGVQHSIVEKYGCNAGEGGYVLRITATDKVMFGTRDDCNNGTSVTGNISIPANTWTHVAGHWDGAAMRVFVNGVQDGAAVASTRNPKDGPTAMKIGERGNGGSPFNGLIDEVRLWSTTRSAAQINANKGICIPIPTANLRGYWKLDEAAGATAADSSGNGNTGNLVNGPAHTAVVAPVTCP
jgi:hypothetical protein